MTLSEAMTARHAVREYEEKELEENAAEELEKCIRECNEESGLHIQLIRNEPKAFSGGKASYGKFSGVTNYLAMVGKKGMDEEIGYYGEKIVLLAQQLGLNTCWVALTFSKIREAYQVDAGEKLYIVVALGYGRTQGVPHKVKSASEVSSYEGEAPEWFENGVKAALLAPTAMNQQKFRLAGNGNEVKASAGLGFYTKIDLGIVKYHFKIGAGKDNFSFN